MSDEKLGDEGEDCYNNESRVVALKGAVRS